MSCNHEGPLRRLKKIKKRGGKRKRGGGVLGIDTRRIWWLLKQEKRKNIKNSRKRKVERV